jgi:hypothetical protein
MKVTNQLFPLYTELEALMGTITEFRSALKTKKFLSYILDSLIDLVNWLDRGGPPPLICTKHVASATHSQTGQKYARLAHACYISCQRVRYAVSQCSELWIATTLEDYMETLSTYFRRGSI